MVVILMVTIPMAMGMIDMDMAAIPMAMATPMAEDTLLFIKKSIFFR